MQLVKERKFRKKIKKQFNYDFEAERGGLYLIEISARARSEKQISINETDDDDLRIEINNQKFPKLDNPKRYFDSPASFSGGRLHNLKKTVIFLIQLSKGNHKISFIPDRSPLLEDVSIKFVGNNISDINLDINQRAENGDRRPWITFVLVDLPIKSFTTKITTQYRLIDSDDVKIIIDNKTQKQSQSVLHRFWIFAGSLIKKLLQQTEIQEKTFNPNLSQGLHYIELWADKTPTLHKIEFNTGEIDFRTKAKVVWQETVLREKPDQNSKAIFEKIKKDEKVVILEKAIKGGRPPNENDEPLFSNRWHKVEYQERVGFIYSMALEIEEEDKETVKGLVFKKSKELEEDSCLMLAIAKRESKLFPYAVSEADAQGLFQLKEVAVSDVNTEFGKDFRDRFDINQNIEAGILYFQLLKEKYRNKDNFWERCLAGWNRGWGKVKADEPFIINDQPIETRQFIKDVFKLWEDCKDRLKGAGKTSLFPLLIGILAFASLGLFLFKESFPIPSSYKDHTILVEEKIDVNKDGIEERIVAVNDRPNSTFGITRILLIQKDGSFLELPGDGTELQWWKIDDFNKNGEINIAVLYGYSGSAGFGTFYLYEWTGSDFKILFSKEDIGNEVDFRDLDNDGVAEILYTYHSAKWTKEQSEIYKWDQEGQKYMTANFFTPIH